VVVGVSAAREVVDAVAVLAAVLLGTACGGGAVLACAGAARRPRAPRRSRAGRMRTRLPAAWRGPRLVGALFAGIVTGALTGWPVAGLLAAVGVLTLPTLLGPDREAARRVERMEGIATFTEMLRDTLSAAAGLEQALLAAADLAPAAVRDEVRALAGRIRSGQPLPAALETFAREVDDPAADTVVTVLVMASRRQAAQLAPLLGALAEAVREQVAMRQRVASGRTSVRTSVRVCCATTLGLAAVLVCFNRAYLAPFDGLEGQLALATAGALFAGSFAWLHSMAKVREAPRLLAPEPERPAPEVREAVSRT
jgi:Flp pilus assembly protein TadB